jgi:hypothetical protein
MAMPMASTTKHWKLQNRVVERSRILQHGEVTQARQADQLGARNRLCHLDVVLLFD